MLLMEHKTTCVVNSMIKSTTWATTTDPIIAYKNVIDILYTMFLGINLAEHKSLEKEKLVSKAKYILTNMQLCNICFLDQFFGDYEKYLYQLTDKEDYKKFVRDYLLKIPLIGEKALERFNVEATEFEKYSLGCAHKLVKEEISKICDLTRKQKQLKSFSKKCCDKIIEQPLEYGCRKTQKSSKKYSYKKHTKKYRFVRKKKPFKPGKFVKKKFDKKFSNDKQKFCPKGKKNCRCWICNEEGHYANKRSEERRVGKEC